MKGDVLVAALDATRKARAQELERLCSEAMRRKDAWGNPNPDFSAISALRETAIAEGLMGPASPNDRGEGEE